jgi:hypothetical protein
MFERDIRMMQQQPPLAGLRNDAANDAMFFPWILARQLIFCCV